MQSYMRWMYYSNDFYHLEESYLSPYKIDLDLVQPSPFNPAPFKVKFMCIYNKIMKSPKFKSLFVYTFGESENLNVRFKLVDHITPRSGSTLEPNGITIGSSSSNPLTGEITGYNSIIEINKNNMDVSSLSIARTIIHESLHAYLTVKQYTCSGTSFDALKDKDLGELLTLYHSTACSAQSDHEFMFDHMIPTISEVLEDIKDDLVPLAHQTAAEQDFVFVDENNPNGAKVPWNWNQFFKYFSMRGLHNGDAFQFEMLPTTSDKHRNYQSYGNIGQNGFSKDCN